MTNQTPDESLSWISRLPFSASGRTGEVKSVRGLLGESGRGVEGMTRRWINIWCFLTQGSVEPHHVGVT